MNASLVYGNTLYSAASTQFPAALNLIEGIYSQFQLQAFYLLRKRIYTEDPPSETIYGAIKVAAKSITFGGPPQPLSILKTIRVQPVPPPLIDSALLNLNLSSPTLVFDFLDDLISNRSQSEHKYLSDRPISAVLVSKDHQIISYSRSYSSLNRVFHAEYVLLKRMLARGVGKIPVGSKLYTTLKPCKMCAGLIWDLSEDIQKTEVIFRDFDPGPNGRSTVLDSDSYERKRCNSLGHSLVGLDHEKNSHFIR